MSEPVVFPSLPVEPRPLEEIIRDAGPIHGTPVDETIGEALFRQARSLRPVLSAFHIGFGTRPELTINLARCRSANVDLYIGDDRLRGVNQVIGSLEGDSEHVELIVVRKIWRPELVPDGEFRLRIVLNDPDDGHEVFSFSTRRLTLRRRGAVVEGMDKHMLVVMDSRGDQPSA